jgi:hypothetical protein
MHWRQGRFLITLEKLADADDDIQRRAQLMANRF